MDKLPKRANQNGVESCNFGFLACKKSINESAHVF